MDRRRTVIGVLLVTAALCVMTYVVITSYPSEHGKSRTEHVKQPREHENVEKQTPVPSVAGKCFQNREERFFFYTDRYVVITAIGTNSQGGSFENRNWYEYSIKDDALKLKNGVDSFSCPYRAEVDAIVIDGERYALDKNPDQFHNAITGHTYARGGQSYQFISDDTVVVALEDEKITEAWGYAIEGEWITFTYGTGGAEEKRKFEVMEKGIRMDGEVFGKE